MAILIEGDNTINVQLVSTVALPKGTLVGGVFIAGTGPNWVSIAGATVRAVGPHPSTASRTTTSGSDGSYSFSNLEPGGYDVHFSKSGYQSYSEPVNIYAGQTSELNVALVSEAPPPPPTPAYCNKAAFNAAYGSKVGDPNYNSIFDFNNDGKIDLRDFVTFVKRCGE